jgi:hypothetical protein
VPDDKDERDTPRTGSIRLGSPPQVPTLKTLSAQVAGMGGQIFGARKDIDSLLERQTAMQGDLTVMRRALLGEQTLRLGPLPSPSSLIPPPSSQPRPSMAVKAGKTTAQVAPWALVVLGLVSEIAARHTAHGGAFSAILKLIFPDAAP